jgi:hypothetical protein
MTERIPKTSFAATAACRPEPGFTYLTIGQDLFSVAEYLREQYNASLHDYIAAMLVAVPEEDTPSATAQHDNRYAM